MSDNNNVLGPLNDQVVQREYSTPKINFGDNAPIPEAVISNAPPKPAPETATSEPGKSTDSKKENPGINPPAAEIPDSVKREGAEKLAEQILNVYGLLKKAAGGQAVIKDKKIKKLVAEKKLDLLMMIPVDEQGNAAPLGAYVKAYNDEITTLFSVSQEFKEEVTPPMVRELMKMNLVPTDRQLLMVLFGVDIAMTAAMFMKLQKQQAEMMETWQAMNANYHFSENKSQNQQQHQAPQQNTHTEEPAQPSTNSTPKTPTPQSPGDGIVDDTTDSSFVDIQPQKGEFQEPEEMAVKLHESVIISTPTPVYGEKDTLIQLEKHSEQNKQ